MSGEPALGVALLNFHRDLGCDGLLNVKHPIAVAAAKLVDGSLVELSDHAAHGGQCVPSIKDYYNDRHTCKRYFGANGGREVGAGRPRDSRRAPFDFAQGRLRYWARCWLTIGPSERIMAGISRQAAAHSPLRLGRGEPRFSRVSWAAIREFSYQWRIVMARLSAWKVAGVVFVLFAATAIGAQAQTFTTLVDFDGNDGAEPLAALVQGADGNLYGTTSMGGISNSQCFGSCGTAFKITVAGSLTTMYEFCAQPDCTDGYDPIGGLVLGTDGNFYGTTEYGGTTIAAGTVFKISRNGTLITLYNFCSKLYCADGENSTAPLFEAANGHFYGTTQLGGVYGTFGTAFEITPTGNLTTVFSFDKKDGESPYGGLIQGSDGNFYGTTFDGGKGQGCFPDQGGCGTAFRLTPGGKLTTVHSFCPSPTNCSDGAQPQAGLIQATDGNLYGVTSNGATHGYAGTIFRIAPTGTTTTFYNFCAQPNCADGGEPAAPLIQGSDGNLYGTTLLGGDINCNLGYGYGCGTVFRITPQGSLTTLHTFESSDGAFPLSLVQATNGTFYGVTNNGGTFNSSCSEGCGTIFSLDVSLGPFVTFVRAAGKVGQTGGILGQGFTGTTSVSLNGIAANFTVVSDTFIKATVPAGATTGYVTVATPSGTLTSNLPFRVLP